MNERVHKDYRHDVQRKTRTLEAEEFIRRFLLHPLCEGFQRISYDGSWPTQPRAETAAPSKASGHAAVA